MLPKVGGPAIPMPICKLAVYIVAKAGVHAGELGRPRHNHPFAVVHGVLPAAMRASYMLSRPERLDYM